MNKDNFNICIDIWKGNNETPDCFIDLGCGVIKRQLNNCESKWFNDVYPDSLVIGLEPEPQRYESHRDNNFKGILLNKGIYKEECKISVCVENRYGMVNMSQNHNNRGYKYIDIECTTLDKIYQEYGPFSNIF